MADKIIRKRKGLGKKDKVSPMERAAFYLEQEHHKKKEFETAKDWRLAEDKSQHKNKESTYRVRAKRELQEEHPEWFRETNAGTKVLDRSKISMEDYFKEVKKKEDELVTEDVKEDNYNNSKKGKMTNFFKNIVYQKPPAGDRRDAEVDKKVKEHKKKPKLKGWAEDAKKGFVDLGSVTLKLAGDLSGLSGIGKKLGDAGVLDDFKSNVKNFGKDILGISLNITTKKDKEDEEKEKTKKYRSNIKDSATIMETTSTEIEKLLTSFRGYKERQQEAEIEAIKAQNAKEAEKNKPKGDGSTKK